MTPAAKKGKIILACFMLAAVGAGMLGMHGEKAAFVGGMRDGSKFISGSIFQPVYGQGWTQSDWEAEFDRMKDVGMDHLILQWTIQKDTETKEVYFRSSVYTSDAGWFVPNDHDMLNDLLTAAQNKGIDVWVGINWSDDWWAKAGTDFAWLDREAEFAVNVVRDIWNSPEGYKNKASFKGWYLPWEIDNVNYMSPVQQRHLREALKTVVSYTKTNTGKPMMISPFFADGDGQTKSQWTAMWQYLLDETEGADIDIVALQDGIGVHHASIDSIGDWLRATKAATDTNTGCQLWANIETFEEVASGVYHPAEIEKIIAQIDAESPIAEKLTCFSFNAFQSHLDSGCIQSWCFRR